MPTFEHRTHAWADDLVIPSWSAGPRDAPAVLMLHGYPQNHQACLPVARQLARDHRVILMDLRGYGDSLGPAPDEKHLLYCKRAMAADAARVMDDLGIARFAVVGHDRGGRVAHRLALDHPARVRCLSSLTVIPTPEMWGRVNLGFGLQAYHWFMLAQPHPLPDKLLAADPAFFLDFTLARMAHGRDFIPPGALADYHRCFAKASVRQAMIEDYRAAASIDREHDQADVAAGRRLACPVQVLWEQGRYADGETPVDIWRRWATDVVGEPVAAGHLMMEEAPDAVAARVDAFLRMHATLNP